VEMRVSMGKYMLHEHMLAPVQQFGELLLNE
jgi:hypothetical protein